MSLTRCQFHTLAVLARKPKAYKLVWAGCGAASFGEGDDPADRFGNAALILSVPEDHRWPLTNTIRSLERHGFIERQKERYFFYKVFQITAAGLSAYRGDAAYDSAMAA